MTRPEVQVLIPIWQAYASGQEVEWRHIPGMAGPPCSEWRTYNNCAQGGEPHFDSPHIEWRVKPSPREWWVCLGCMQIHKCDRFGHPCGFCMNSELVHVREVLPPSA